jgi:TP901 family phage tail tape measure protein
MATIQDSTLNIVIKAKNQASATLNEFNAQAGKTMGAGRAAALAVQAVGVAAGGLAIKMGVDAVKAAVNFETKMAEVRKTTGFSADETKKFGEEILNMSKTLPVATDSLSDIASVAGQLGITGTQNILDFTKIIAMGNVALPEFGGNAEALALSVSKAKNVFGFTVPESKNLLSAWNELSNTTSANALEISKFTDNLGGTAKLIGITAGETAALGAAIVSLGGDADASGTEAKSAFSELGKNIEKAAKIAGVSTQEMKKRMDEDIIKAVQDINDGIFKITSNTDRNAAAIDIYGMIGSKAMLRLVGHNDILNATLKTQAEAIAKNTSLDQEFAIASETVAKQWVTFNNNVNAMLVNLGNFVLPKINDGLKLMLSYLGATPQSELATSIVSLGDQTQKTIDKIKELKKEGKDTSKLEKIVKENQELSSKITDQSSLQPLSTENLSEAGKKMSNKLDFLNPFSAIGNLLGFAEGGIVPGPSGAAQLAVVHGGETITPPNKQNGTTIIFDLKGATITDSQLINRIKDALRRENELTYQGVK